MKTLFNPSSTFMLLLLRPCLASKYIRSIQRMLRFKKNTEVLNTSRCLDAINTMVLVYFDFGKAEVPNRASMFRVTLDTRQQ
jgi:hypothetical protein